eukprot:scaffold22688_cov172-Cylindrotheca_fusiformis.AAC.2
MAEKSATSSTASLAPSQALRPSAAPWQPNNGKNDKSNTKGKPNRRRRKPNKSKVDGESKQTDLETDGIRTNLPNTGPRKNRRRRGGGSQNQASTNHLAEADRMEDGSGNQQRQSGPVASKGSNKGKGNKNKNSKKRRKRYPWRRFIPKGTVDPISLENLISLEYPPFALVATKPYTPVPVWPLPETSLQTDGKEVSKKAETVEEINRRRLQEQWGQVIPATEGIGEEVAESQISGDRHLHLYDGRALAYYLVSQLQFIDPLNRRDLTRPELLNLDAYLKRHGFNDLRVTEAYDAKGITISSAGAAASTAEGRAQILQQMAANLLNTLFDNRAASRNPTPASAQASLQEQYTAMRQQEEQTHRRLQNRQQQGNNQTDVNPFGDGYYASEDGGLIVIDDDENPGMRGDTYTSAGRGMTQPAMGDNFGSPSHPFYTASHIAHGEGRLGASPDAFPALSEVASTQGTNPPAPAPQQPKAAAKSKTLSRISGAVKKTDPEEIQKQWEAREEARRRAMLSNLSLGVDASAQAAVQSLPKPPPGLLRSLPPVTPSEGQLSRNQALADALGVKPATVRNQFSSGWARPTDSTAGLDEFGNELNAAIYPESLIAEARERIPFLLKLEKKWKTFLADDTAASLPLNAMDRPARKFTHEYSDFWNLRTESFDPEPKRYIHCVKMENTYMPHPLLSEVARNWRGPSSYATRIESDHTVQQTPGQSTRSLAAYPSEQRTALSLKPRSIPPGEQKDFQPVKTEKDVSLGEQLNTRFDSLSSDRERPKLELAKRTIPLELPPFEQQQAFNLAEDMKRSKEKAEERKRKEQEAAARKMKALEAAFASDEENEDHDSEEEWQEEAPLYAGSDSEE